MAGPFAPDATMLTAIIHQLAVTIQAQIPSIAKVYEDYPDRSPADNTVVLPLKDFKVLDDTNGKLKVLYTFNGRHLFRRREMGDNLKTAYSYIAPWLLCLSAWPNTSLGGLAVSMSAKTGSIVQVSEAGQPMVALAVTFEVLTEYNIPLM